MVDATKGIAVSGLTLLLFPKRKKRRPLDALL
jgi:hypothetical protein